MDAADHGPVREKHVAAELAGSKSEVIRNYGVRVERVEEKLRRSIVNGVLSSFHVDGKRSLDRTERTNN
jgi:hypothetical protein